VSVGEVVFWLLVGVVVGLVILYCINRNRRP
jgi:hypothetical protein